ncbi:MAG: hypothetical protein EZS28_018266 [Streblomastix strix]|uniref:Uncharacterized protein n=1 Tax=Streblomastix strix TaxID=222440 RepID=A0A5J4VVM0_9EUKA|nr:MAG: hypothetical protein EZS28_018266 [Streblomastix strix]
MQILRNKDFKVSLKKEFEEILLRCLQVISSINLESSSKVIDWMIKKQQEVKLIGNIMSSADGQDDDDLISEAVRNLVSLVSNVNENKYLDPAAAQLRNEIQDNIEEEGIIEEEQALLFHTDTREKVGVKKRVSKLNDRINQ